MGDAMVAGYNDGQARVGTGRFDGDGLSSWCHTVWLQSRDLLVIDG